MHEGLPGCGERNGEPSARPRLAQWADRLPCNPHSRMCRPVNTFCDFGVASGGQDFACGSNASRVACEGRPFQNDRGGCCREAPVGIEPTNRGFAVAQERLRSTLSRCIALHQPRHCVCETPYLCVHLTQVVPHLCPGGPQPVRSHAVVRSLNFVFYCARTYSRF